MQIYWTGIVIGGCITIMIEIHFGFEHLHMKIWAFALNVCCGSFCFNKALKHFSSASLLAWLCVQNNDTCTSYLNRFWRHLMVKFTSMSCLIIEKCHYGRHLMCSYISILFVGGGVGLYLVFLFHLHFPLRKELST